MPVPTTNDDLLDLIRKSELVPADRLEAFMNQSGSSTSKPRELMNLLVAAGLVTQFQAEQFLQGKWRGFAIGKYKVLERLGSGGMGTVYLCEHMVVCRKVAVKVLPTSQANNPSALGRFYREARAAGVLDHPNLVKAHDVDQEGPLHFLVMDYVDGASLQEIVTRFGPLSVTRACHYIRQSATGLQAAHEAGLIHRDVKPANIMLQRDGTIRVLDLGLARFTHDNVDLLTLKYDEKNVLGTADYVAPEQALNSHEVDIRCDIYGLGGTFYYLLTGNLPFPGGKIAQKLIWHQCRQPEPIRSTRSDVPEELEAVVNKMMAKDADDRYQTPLEVIKAIAPWTKTPIPPPRDEEMPRLSPAVVGIPGSGAPPRSQPQIRLPRRSSNPGTTRRPAAVVEQESNGHVSTLHRTAAPPEVATPRHLASSQVATHTDHPRARPVARPSRAVERAAHSPIGHDSTLSLPRLAVLAMASGVIGGLLLWIVLR